MAHNIHGAVPLHPTFLCAMLPWEIFKMAMDTEPVGGLVHSQAKKRPWLPAVWRPWPPWRLIATFAKLEILLSPLEQTLKQSLIATKMAFSDFGFSLC